MGTHNLIGSTGQRFLTHKLLFMSYLLKVPLFVSILNSEFQFERIEEDYYLLKPEFKYNVFRQTQIFVSNIRFRFVCQSNILLGFPNICRTDMYGT